MIRTLPHASKVTRARYDALSLRARAFCVLEAAGLYDGSRTVSKCWTGALDAAEKLPAEVNKIRIHP